MANTTIRLRKSGVTSNVPTSLELGELALNYADGKLYYKNAADVITYISSGATTNSFATINSNSSLVIATSNTDILSFAGANGISIFTDTITKTITFDGVGLLDDIAAIHQVDAEQNASILSVTSLATNAYTLANDATNLAQAAYDQANTGGGGGATTFFNYLTVEKQLYTANASQTDFFAHYTAPYVTVVINGSTIDASEYSTGTANTIILNNAASVGDIIDITGFSQANSATIAGSGIDQYARDTANAAFSSTGGTVTGNVSITGDLSVTGNITYTGNVTTVTISGNSGQFFGNTETGFQALYAGIPTGFVQQPQTPIQVSSNFNGYAQLNQQNINSGNQASADFIVTADNGNASDTYADFGMASSTYDYPGFGLIKPNDAYLIAYGNTNTGGGNLIISTGKTNDIVFSVNGVDDTNEVMRINRSNNIVIRSNNQSTSNVTGSLQVQGGVGVTGNVYSDKIFTNGLFWAANGAPISTGGGAGGTNQFNIYKYIANAGQVDFVGLDSTSSGPMIYTPGAIIVTLNGITLKPGTDFASTDGSTISLVVAAEVGDELNVYCFTSTTVNTNTLTTYNYVATTNQTYFGGADSANNILGYVPGNLITTLNGITLRNGVDYIAANGTYINLMFNANANDEISIATFGAFNVANTYTITQADTKFATKSLSLAFSFFGS